MSQEVMALCQPMEAERREHLPNVRAVLSIDATGEDVGILWPAGARSTVHDHGFRKRNEEYQGSHGVTDVLWGHLYEWRLVDGVWTSFEYRAGDRLTENPDTVHWVGSDTGAITRHRYEPALTGNLTVFPEE